ncbi:MAG: glutamine--tRNA ligase/YqeY domain fusion protein [Chitinophagaceae bacterium]
MSEEKSLNFLEEIIEKDISEKKIIDGIHTRFPPEPNGYLHIGHAKAICINFELAKKYQGSCNLRFDDTNPSTEETEYVESIKKDIEWLGYTWKEELYTSDYFEKLFQFAHTLIEKGLAYVDDSSSEEIAKQKGTPTQAGTNSPYRDRSVDENKNLFQEMREGKYADGEKVLRAKIDMAHTNMLMRDPVIYRIKHAHHHRTGNAWCIYPMYDFAHGQSDSIEHITHSLCSIEFVPHRELYDWFIEKLEIFPSKQYEFARGNVNYTVTSKRKLLQLVQEKHVSGWDDPRMPTLSGLRRRGFTAHSIKQFWHTAGVAKRENVIDMSLLEHFLREELNQTSLRRMAVLNPLKLVINNLADDFQENLTAENNPEKPEEGHRNISFSKHLWIEQEDFMQDPPKKYFRLSPGQSVRLKHAYIITCTHADFDAHGNATCIYADLVPNSKSGNDTSGLKVKGTLHWVNAMDCVEATARIYDRLFTVENPGAEDDFKQFLNPKSLEIFNQIKIEKALLDAKENEHFQFFRLGYFCLDKESTKEHLLFNKTVGLKEGYKK